MNSSRRIAPRLRLALLLPVIAGALTAGPLLVWRLHNLIQGAAADTLSDTLEVLAPLVARDAEQHRENLQERVRSLAVGAQLRLTLIAEDGVVLADSARTREQVAGMDDHRTRPEVATALVEGQGTSVRLSATTGLEYVYAAMFLTTSAGEPLLVRVARPLSQLSELRAQLGSTLLLSLLGGLAAGGGAVWWLRSRLALPFEKLVQGSRRLAEGDLLFELQEPPGEELRTLARSINELAARYRERLADSSEEAARLREVLESLEDGVLVTEEDGGEVVANAAFFRLLGNDEEGGPGRALQIIRQPALRSLHKEALEGGTDRRENLEVVDRTGVRRHLDVTTSRLENSGRVLFLLRDLTTAVHLDQVRRDLVANASHELKTPLAAVRGYVETLLDGALQDGDRAERFLQGILRQCERLEATLGDLLTLSRLESVELEATKEKLCLAEIIHRSREAMGSLATRAGVKVSVETAGEGEMEGDPVAMEGLVLNLLENAIRHCRSGGRVEVRLDCQGDRWRLEVEDDGSGIPGEALNRIFERFYRVDLGRSRREGGTGLGLAIVKHAAQLHGGRVEVESEEGAGSLFRVLLPATGETRPGEA